jgi:hypothetical protein
LLVSNSIFDGKKVVFSLRKPFDTILECKKLGNWGGIVYDVRTRVISSKQNIYMPTLKRFIA